MSQAHEPKFSEGALISAKLDGNTVIANVTTESRAIILGTDSPLQRHIGEAVELVTLQNVKILAETPNEAIALMRRAAAAKNS